MPTYSYECKKCACVRDVFHGMSAEPAVKCEECGGTMRRLIGAGAGVIFKGSGFYETDYKNKNGSSKGGKANGESKSAAKTEPKSEAKSDSSSTSSSTKSE